MCLLWFRNLLYLYDLPSVLEKLRVLSSLPPTDVEFLVLQNSVVHQC